MVVFVHDVANAGKLVRHHSTCSHAQAEDRPAAERWLVHGAAATTSGGASSAACNPRGSCHHPSAVFV